tara:strand:+ start:2470 stop:2598 length:129 start_codon:yes stop_codon:yes gene_type:complete
MKNKINTYKKYTQKKRPGIHSKNASRLKKSKGYKKKYKGQGK